MEVNVSKQPKKTYSPPQVKTEGAAKPPLLLVCTGQFDCTEQAGFQCCANGPDCQGCN
jgi:hypothetical protein